MLRDAFLHVAPGEPLHIRIDALGRCRYGFLVAHGLQLLESRFLRLFFGKLFRVPFRLTLCFGLFMGLASCRVAFTGCHSACPCVG